MEFKINTKEKEIIFEKPVTVKEVVELADRLKGMDDYIIKIPFKIDYSLLSL